MGCHVSGLGCYACGCSGCSTPVRMGCPEPGGRSVASAFGSSVAAGLASYHLGNTDRHRHRLLWTSSRRDGGGLRGRRIPHLLCSAGISDRRDDGLHSYHRRARTYHRPPLRLRGWKVGPVVEQCRNAVRTGHETWTTALPTSLSPSGNCASRLRLMDARSEAVRNFSWTFKQGNVLALSAHLEPESPRSSTPSAALSRRPQGR